MPPGAGLVPNDGDTVGSEKGTSLPEPTLLWGRRWAHLWDVTRRGVPQTNTPWAGRKVRRAHPEEAREHARTALEAGHSSGKGPGAGAPAVAWEQQGGLGGGESR